MILGFRQNCTRKREVGHCDLILQYFFFILIVLISKVPLLLHMKKHPNIPCHSGEKADFIGFANLALAAILDSRPP